MPVQPTYPGVYVQEVSSGVKTIMGVSTSVCAFVGTARRGPINEAVNILSYSDFERQFGGLETDSEMSYAVRQFFMNGGTNSWVVRLAKNAGAAYKTLNNGASTAVDILTFTALNEGKTGNNIELRIDYNTNNPASTFNLTIIYTSPDNPQENTSEKYSDLSMNRKDARYIKNIVNDDSGLIKVERIDACLSSIDTAQGTSTSGSLTGITTLIDNKHNKLRLSLDGSPPFDILITTNTNNVDDICSEIQGKVQTAFPADEAFKKFSCAPDSDGNIEMTSGTTGEFSRVRVLPGLTNDVTSRLKLGTLFGGTEVDAVATIRPAVTLNNGTLTSGTLTGANLTGPPILPSTGNSKLQIIIDTYGPDMIDIGTTAPTGSVNAQLTTIASLIQDKVRQLKPNNKAYNNFTCTALTNSPRLLLSSGNQGINSSVSILAVPSDNLADGLKLTAVTLAVSTSGKIVTLEHGSEDSFTADEAYNYYIGSRADKKGIYALEKVDLFNLMCLPGVSDSGILMDAASYCQERRAFLIADAPKSADKLSSMVTTISGTALPKSDYAAVYYPWIKIGDPLNGGKLRSYPPSGTIAGLYARIDSSRGVWKAPAGTEASLIGVQGVDYPLTDQENGILNPLGVNCIRIFPLYGAIAWGARTLMGADQMTSEYKYIPVRRLALFLEESLYRGLKWVVFEPNDEPLWMQIRLNIGAFMHDLFVQGAFQGVNPKDAYFVKCDKETTTQNEINQGVVNIWVGFAPLKPAEFVILHIQQMAGKINQ